MGEEKYAVWLEVAAGPDKGRRFEVPEGECVIGRASSCEIVLADPLLSRRHCALARGTTAGASAAPDPLWPNTVRPSSLQVRDLESANGTFVNGAEIKSAELHDGDTIEIGETRLVVRREAARQAEARGTTAPHSGIGEAPADARGATALQSEAGETPIVDLGLGESEAGEGEAPAKPNWRPLLWAVAAVAILATAASVILRGGDEPEAPQIAAIKEPSLLPLTVAYEKIEANTESIFRYALNLSAERRLSIEIDDLAEDRHVRKDAEIAEENVKRLAKQLERAGLFSVESPSPGLAADGSLARRSLTVAAGPRVAEASVENRAAPQAFEALCELLETFGRNELGIWAIQYPAEKLVEMAEECFTRAQNLYEQRAIAHGNLFAATKACKEAIFYLETVEPKPEFFAELLATGKDAEEELQRRYEEQRFKADRAINLKEWGAAAEALRTLRELVPDEGDPRNADATRTLLDVERRIGSRGK